MYNQPKVPGRIAIAMPVNFFCTGACLYSPTFQDDFLGNHLSVLFRTAEPSDDMRPTALRPAIIITKAVLFAYQISAKITRLVMFLECMWTLMEAKPHASYMSNKTIFEDILFYSNLQYDSVGPHNHAL